MGFNLLTVFGGVFASWAVLSLLGGERQRRLNSLEVQRLAAKETEAAKPAVAAPPPPATKKPSPAARQSTR